MNLGSYRWLIAALLFVAVIALLRPWTVRPVVDGKAVLSSAVSAPAFDAGQALTSRLAAITPAPAASASATAALLQGEGRVLQIDTSSRLGLALIDLAPGDGRPDVALQIGPVARGSALRDVLGYGFGDFESQMAFARAADDLNARALDGLALLKDAPTLTDKQVRFTGAGAVRDGRVEVLPVALELIP